MEIKELLNKYSIIGIISNYKDSLNDEMYVKELKINNRDNAYKMVNLNNVDDKKIKDLGKDERFKIDLMNKLNNDIILIGNLSDNLCYKEQEYIKKILIKLSNDFKKKIIIIDNDINIFFNITNNIAVIKNDKLEYFTDNYFDDKLYEYVNMPKIIEFIKYINKDNKVLNENVDIYELIKDIYRCVS